jgi:hypothetical protein
MKVTSKTSYSNLSLHPPKKPYPAQPEQEQAQQAQPTTSQLI